MNTLKDLPNIGAVLERELLNAGIGTPERLRELGSRQTFLILRQSDPAACLHKLLALEGAVRGVRKSELSQAEKDSLKAFFSGLDK